MSGLAHDGIKRQGMLGRSGIALGQQFSQFGELGLLFHGNVGSDGFGRWLVGFDERVERGKPGDDLIELRGNLWEQFAAENRVLRFGGREQGYRGASQVERAESMCYPP